MKKNYSSLVITLLLSNVSVASADPLVPDAGLIMRESTKAPNLQKKATDIDIETPALRKPMTAQSNLHIKVLGFTL